MLWRRKILVFMLRLKFRFLAGPVRPPVSISTGLSHLNTKREVGGGERLLSLVVTYIALYMELFLDSQNGTKIKIKLSIHNRTRL